jgi:hypothetical protein
MSDLLLDVKVRTIEGGIRGGERASGVKVRQIMAVAYQAITAVVLSAAPGGTGWGELLPPSSGPTQAGTTPRVAFRVLIGPSGEVEMSIAL